MLPSKQARGKRLVARPFVLSITTLRCCHNVVVMKSKQRSMFGSRSSSSDSGLGQAQA